MLSTHRTRPIIIFCFCWYSPIFLGVFWKRKCGSKKVLIDRFSNKSIDWCVCVLWKLLIEFSWKIKIPRNYRASLYDHFNQGSSIRTQKSSLCTFSNSLKHLNYEISNHFCHAFGTFTKSAYAAFFFFEISSKLYKIVLESRHLAIWKYKKAVIVVNFVESWNKNYGEQPHIYYKTQLYENKLQTFIIA